MIEGLDHSLYTLELEKRPASPDKTDIEATGINWSPGNRGFATRFERMILDFLAEREGLLRQWCASKGMDEPSQPNNSTHSDYPLHQRHQTQLYLILDVSLFFLSFFIYFVKYKMLTFQSYDIRSL